MAIKTTYQTVYFTVGGAIIIRPDGKRLYIKGGPDNNPTMRLLKSIQANVHALEAATEIEDVALRERMQDGLSNVLAGQVEHLVESHTRG